MPGHHDAGNEYTSLEDAQNAALYAKEQGLGGKYGLQKSSGHKGVNSSGHLG